VYSEHSRDTRFDCRVGRRDRGCHNIQVVRNQCREETRSAVGAMCCANRTNPLNGRHVVEHHTTTAVHLDIDETREQ